MTDCSLALGVVLLLLMILGATADRRHKDLETRVDFLFKRGGLRPTDIASDDVKRLTRENKKLAAIRLLRHETGLGLKEAKRIVAGIDTGT